MVDYDNYFYYSALYNEYKTALRQLFWQLCVLFDCLVTANYVVAHPLLRWVSKVYHPWAYNTYSTVTHQIAKPRKFSIDTIIILMYMYMFRNLSICAICNLRNYLLTAQITAQFENYLPVDQVITAFSKWGLRTLVV